MLFVLIFLKKYVDERARVCAALARMVDKKDVFHSTRRQKRFVDSWFEKVTILPWKVEEK
jgi:hypothetical protein